MHNFRSIDFLKSHINTIFNFYHPACIDDDGGFFHIYKTDGSIVKPTHRHLVNSTRFIINYARLSFINNDTTLLDHSEHGIRYLQTKHKQVTNGYSWEIDNNRIIDTHDYCYGHAFVVLSYAECIKQGLTHYQAPLEEAYKKMQEKFWEPKHTLYTDIITETGITLPYRGQNSNMHSCEAMLSAYQATSEKRFLERAYNIARTITVELPSSKQPLIWEHYHTDWSTDWEYNIDKPDDMFRPWGFQTGHQTEWAKLLMILYTLKPEQWMLSKAEYLFEQAMHYGWDKQYGGLYYGFAPDGTPCDTDKHFWVQAESFAAAAYLAVITGKDKYWQYYDSIWTYSWEHMIDHQYGAWHHKLDRAGTLYSDIKSPLGKCDYHTIGACYDVLNALTLSSQKLAL